MMPRYSMLAMLLLPALVHADVLNLSDGTRLEGTVQRQSGGWNVTDASGKITFVADARVRGVEKSSTLTPAQIADSKFNLLRRQVESVTDLGQIIDRYAKFVEQNKGTPAAAAARKELDVWNERLAKKMVKVGATWMTAQDQAALAEKTVPLIDEARSHIKDGRIRQASEVIDKVLDQEPRNASALYLRGLVAYKQDQLGLAKKSFELARDVMKDHAPTLNNLAVVNWQQRQHAAAIAHYDQALLATAQNRQILDNVAEALHALPSDVKSSTVARRLGRRFEEQDAQLQKQLEQEGLYRWGGSYITQAQTDEIKKAQQQTKAKLDALTQEYEKAKQRLVEIDSTIDANRRALNRMDTDRSVIDPRTGQIIVLGRPGAYYELRRDNDRLRDERDEILTRLPSFQDRSAAIQREGPSPAYSGKQRLIETEGTPLILPPNAGGPPATQPAGVNTTRAVSLPATQPASDYDPVVP